MTSKKKSRKYTLLQADAHKEGHAMTLAIVGLNLGIVGWFIYSAGAASLPGYSTQLLHRKHTFVCAASGRLGWRGMNWLKLKLPSSLSL